MEFKRNMGVVDRVVRTFIAIFAGILIISGNISGIAGVILGIFAIVFLITSMISFCPMYVLLGISTVKKAEELSGGDTEK